MHSDIDTVERVEIIRDLRAGEFDVLVGINLLREGLDLPEVSLVAILDADKEGFLRSTRSLIQTIGRAARNLHGRAILYADRITGSMKQAMEETDRRRVKQHAYNVEHGITPKGVAKSVKNIIDGVPGGGYERKSGRKTGKEKYAIAEEIKMYGAMTPSEVSKQLEMLEKEMYEHARNLEFEQAAAIRDKIKQIDRTVFGKS